MAFDPLADAYVDPPVSDTFEVCLGGDGVCPVACVATDPDCITTCGDGTCVGNAGELCGNCTADCATTSAVCGNARCESGEYPDCYADCGPAPWTWTTQETNLLAEVNKKRTNGVTCPGQTMRRTAPALTLSTSAVTKNAAREWAWELAHHQFNAGPAQAGATCNGRTFAQRSNAGGFDSGLYSTAATGALNAANIWANDAAACPLLMSQSYTKASAAVALAADNGWILTLD